MTRRTKKAWTKWRELIRSEEGRVGEEGRFRWAADHFKKKKKPAMRKVASCDLVPVQRSSTEARFSHAAGVMRPMTEHETTARPVCLPPLTRTLTRALRHL